MFRFATMTALFAALAAPVYADGVQPADDGAVVTFSARTPSGLAAAVRHLNEDADHTRDIVTAAQLTLVSGTPTYGADIFARLAAESDG